jgi:MYXO-CTERM domain-containing protein
VVFVAFAIFPASAYAQTPDGGTDADALAAEIDSDWTQLQSSDCDTACRALDSMRRATDRLCTMDPGERCSRARKKLADATSRVRSACPNCPEATGRVFPESEKTEAPPPPPSNAATEEAVQKKRGGCAGCTVGQAPDGAAVATSLLAFALLMRRRARRANTKR